jgi:hypothetical protein
MTNATTAPQSSQQRLALTQPLTLQLQPLRPPMPHRLIVLTDTAMVEDMVDTATMADVVADMDGKHRRWYERKGSERLGTWEWGLVKDRRLFDL